MRSEFGAPFLTLISAPGSTAELPDFSGWPEVSGPYLGQSPPGKTAEVFAPDLISTEHSEIGSVFSADFAEFYFTTWTEETGTRIMVTRQVDGTWLAPQKASFSNHPTDVDVAISSDNSRMFFGTRRPRPGETGDTRGGFDVWYADRDGGYGRADIYKSRLVDNVYQEPVNLGPAVNSSKRDFCPMVTPDGRYLFFSSKRLGVGDIFWVDANVITELR